MYKNQSKVYFLKTFVEAFQPAPHSNIGSTNTANLRAELSVHPDQWQKGECLGNQIENNPLIISVSLHS